MTTIEVGADGSVRVHVSNGKLGGGAVEVALGHGPEVPYSEAFHRLLAFLHKDEPGVPFSPEGAVDRAIRRIEKAKADALTSETKERDRLLSRFAVALDVPVTVDMSSAEADVVKAASEVNDENIASALREHAARAAFDRMTLLAARVVEAVQVNGAHCSVGSPKVDAALLALAKDGGEATSGPGWWTHAIERSEDIPF